MKAHVLPTWAEEISPGKVQVDASEAYPTVLDELGIDESKVDQYWLAVARAVMRMDVELGVAGTGSVPENGSLLILVNDSTKGGGVSKWAESAYQRGEGAAAGAKAAKDIYGKLRGVLPA